MAATLDILFSAAPESLRNAAAELARIDPKAGPPRLVGEDAAILTVKGLTLADIAEACRETPALFVRHLTAVDGVFALDDLDGICERALALAPTGAVSLQVWSAEGGAVAPGALTGALRDALTKAGHDVRRGGADVCLHVCVATGGAVLGSAAGDEALSDWPGGRVRLRAGKDQLSRAALKLEEAMLTFGLDLRGPGVAVDLGAAPGGWSKVLAERGYRVAAVDPAKLDASLGRNRNITHHGQTAQVFLAQQQAPADLIVNDMRLDAVESADVMADAVHGLKPGGLAVMTLKLPEKGAATKAAKALERLRGPYDLIGARQLFHNRSEVTVALRRR